MPVQSTYQGNNLKQDKMISAKSYVTQSRCQTTQSQGSNLSSKVNCVSPQSKVVLKSFIHTNKFESLTQDSLFPNLKPKSSEFYTRQYLRLD